VGLLLGETESMLDGVAAGRDGVLQSLATEHVAARLLAEAMGLVDRRLQHIQRIGRHIVDVAGRRERIGAAGEQLDPIRSALSVLAYGRAAFLSIADPVACQRIDWNVGCNSRAPDDAASRHLEARSVEATFIDGIAHLDIGIAVAVRA